MYNFTERWPGVALRYSISAPFLEKETGPAFRNVVFPLAPTVSVIRN